MKNENRIDNYFSRVKQNPPLMDIEQVLQVITEAKVETESKVKKGHRNFLKFIIMTTLFAAIISAVLWWPGGEKENQVSSIRTQDKGQEKVSSIKYKDTRPLGGDSNSTNTNSASRSYADTKNAESNTDNKLLAMDNLNENSSGVASNQPNEAVGSSEESTQPTQQTIKQPFGFDPDTNRPIDGSKFILKLTNEEFEKIGIRFLENSIVYRNMVNGYCYEYGERKYKGFITKAPDNYNFLTDEKGRKYLEHKEMIVFSRKIWVENENPEGKEIGKPSVVNSSTEKFSFYYEIPHDTIIPTQYDFYPVFKSNEYYGEIFGNRTLYVSDFELANDTLVPVVFPNMEGSSSPEEILWFVLTDQLYKILSVRHKPLMDELMQYKTVKKRFPQKDIIAYRSPFLTDESKILKLSQNELQKMGFSFYADSTGYIGRNSRCQYKVMLSERQTTTQTMHYDELQNPELNNGCLAVLITDSLGVPLFNSLGLLPILFPNEDDALKQIPILIPVEVKAAGFYNSLYFWFLPTENFFKAITKDVSEEIKSEYNYITAEDKSKLEKPVCKYFDECKNTLKVLGFKVFPNPASDNATVSFTLPETIEGRISLVDLSGHERQLLKPQTSYAKGQHSIQIDLSSVPEGIYLLTLYSNKGVQTQRVIVNKL